MANEPNLTAFLDACRNLLGNDHVIADGEALEGRSHDPVYSCQPPAAVVKPGSAGEVSTVVTFARQHRIALWPYSTAMNWGYGNTVGEAGGVVLTLERMNRILDVDAELAYAVLEPGVSFAQLNRHLRDNDVPLWTDCTGGPPSGSVVGNALDRGFGPTPYGDHFAQLCGLEVVLPDGSIVRTGGFGEEPAAGAWHTWKNGVGPVLDGLFSQSNYGIVVRAAVWLMPAPEHFEIAALAMRDDSRLADALNAMRRLMLDGVVPRTGRFTNDISSLTLFTQHRDEAGLDDAECLSPADLEVLRERHGISAWTATLGLYGERALVRPARRSVARALKRFGRLNHITPRRVRWVERLLAALERRPGGGLEKFADRAARRFLGCSLQAASLVPQLRDLFQGIPNESVVRRAYFRHPEPRPDSAIDVAGDGVGVLWFVPVLPFRGGEIVGYLESCAEIFRRHGFDFPVTITPLNPRSVVILLMVLYRRREPSSCERAAALYAELQQDALDRGYQQFRCGHPGWDVLFSNNPEWRSFLDRLKHALDPGSVLAPGRYGIGSKHSPPPSPPIDS